MSVRIWLRGGAAVTAAGTAAAGVLYHCGGPAWLLTAAVIMGTVAYHLLVRLVIGGAVNLAMGNRGNPQSRWFRPRRWEPALYRRLGVKGWKRHMPTYVPELFSLKTHTPEEVAGAMCQAEAVHAIGAAACMLPVAAAKWFGALPVFLLISLASAGLELALVIVQRYNRPRILALARQKKGTAGAQGNGYEPGGRTRKSPDSPGNPGLPF